MSVIWEYRKNTERLDIFCSHCSDIRDTPYFTSGGGAGNIVCLRCARALSRAFAVFGTSNTNPVIDGIRY